jgi:hypothetical protein
MSSWRPRWGKPALSADPILANSHLMLSASLSLSGPATTSQHVIARRAPVPGERLESGMKVVRLLSVR